MENWTAFALGLVGSLHCAAMCGPLILALPSPASTPAGFITGRALYNLGRMLTYGLLGLLFGLVGQTLFLAGVQRWVSIGLGLVLLAGLFGSRRLSLAGPVTGLVQQVKSGMSGLFLRRSLWSLLVLGVLNGLLPCGLVYVACAGATASHDILAGAQYMVFFGLGTVPMMLGISLSGRLLPVSLRLHLRKAIPLSVFLLASLLILRGMSLGIAYVSPNLTCAESNCCHR